ncbi:hypothetical protein ACFL3A_04760 [Pseudomonadota bacterium]
MARKTKGRAGWHQATPNTSKYICNSTGLASRIKEVVVILVLLNLLSLGFVARLIHPLGWVAYE